MGLCGGAVVDVREQEEPRQLTVAWVASEAGGYGLAAFSRCFSGSGCCRYSWAEKKIYTD